MQPTYTISVTEALEQLTYPSFYDSSERKVAFDLVMVLGSNEEREAAERSTLKYPFEQSEEVFSSNEEDDFSIVSSALTA